MTIGWVGLAAGAALLQATQKHIAQRAYRTDKEACAGGARSFLGRFFLVQNTVAALAAAAVAWGYHGESVAAISPALVLFAFFNGLSVFGAILLRTRATGWLPSSLIETLYRSSVLVQLLWGVAVLREDVWHQKWGILTCLLSVGLVLYAAVSKSNQATGARPETWKGVACALVAAVLAATSGIFMDAAPTAGTASVSAFLAIAYGTGALLSPFTSGGTLADVRTLVSMRRHWSSLLGGVAGLALYSAGFLLMGAFREGSFVIVSSIIAIHSVLAIALDAFAWPDQRAVLKDPRVLLGVALMVAGVVLVKTA